MDIDKTTVCLLVNLVNSQYHRENKYNVESRHGN